MPNYEIVDMRCAFRGKQVKCPATYVSEYGNGGKLVRSINDCLSKDAGCASFTGKCRFNGGNEDPFGAAGGCA